MVTERIADDANAVIGLVMMMIVMMVIGEKMVMLGEMHVATSE